MPSALTSEGIFEKTPQMQTSESVLAINEAASISASVLDAVADCTVTKSDGTKVPFKSLYWAQPNRKRKTLIIFIRHFFCGVCTITSAHYLRSQSDEVQNCQEYVRSLKAQVSPESLAADVSIVIVGCGSHTLIDSYICETECPYPIYTDPSKRLYDALGLHRSLSLGGKDPDYIQHSLVAGMMKSIVQGVKRFSAGDALSGGDMRLNGGEFLFEAEGSASSGDGEKGNLGLTSISVAWCHRMVNSRNHTEVDQIRTVLGLEWESPIRRRPEGRWASDASRLRRSLSSRRESWLHRTNSKSRNSSPQQTRESRQSSRRRSPVSAKDSISEEGYKRQERQILQQSIA